MQSTFDQFDLEALYQNQIGLETVERMPPELPEVFVKAINIFRLVRHYMLKGGIEAIDVPVPEISLRLEDSGFAPHLANQVQALFSEQFPNLYSINFNVLEELELALIKKHILDTMLEDKQ